MQIIHFCVPVFTGISKGDKLIKIPSDSLSGSVIFQNFLGACSQTFLVLAWFACLCALHIVGVHIPASPTEKLSAVATYVFNNKLPIQINNMSGQNGVNFQSYQNM